METKKSNDDDMMMFLLPSSTCLSSLCLSVQDAKMNVETLSRAELLTLLSVLEGELEAQDVVIHALRVSPHSASQASVASVTSNAHYNLPKECPGVGGCRGWVGAAV